MPRCLWYWAQQRCLNFLIPVRCKCCTHHERTACHALLLRCGAKTSTRPLCTADHAVQDVSALCPAVKLLSCCHAVACAVLAKGLVSDPSAAQCAASAAHCWLHFCCYFCSASMCALISCAPDKLRAKPRSMHWPAAASCRSHRAQRPDWSTAVIICGKMYVACQHGVCLAVLFKIACVWSIVMACRSVLLLRMRSHCCVSPKCLLRGRGCAHLYCYISMLRCASASLQSCPASAHAALVPCASDASPPSLLFCMLLDSEAAAQRRRRASSGSAACCAPMSRPAGGSTRRTPGTPVASCWCVRPPNAASTPVRPCNKVLTHDGACVLWQAQNTHSQAHD